MSDSSIASQQLCELFKVHPRIHKNRFDNSAERSLIQDLFWSLAGGNSEYLNLLFPDGRPGAQEIWKLRKAQGGADGDEFTEAARGKACGHIFKTGEATYRCKSCSLDDTCVLCSRCFDSSDHTGHMIYVTVSPGNSGCCDCGDAEAWKSPVHCSIHTAHTEGSTTAAKGKAPGLPQDLIESIRMTIGRALDYTVDVLSCSPEQLRLPKTRESILEDERTSRLGSQNYNGDIVEDPCEFALALWNDEKHTLTEVQDHVARACKVSLAEAYGRATETDGVGRSIIKYSTDVGELLRVSSIIEHIKVTVTIRAARDIYREQMCGAIIEWLNDIAGCSVGHDYNILRQTVREELLKGWSTGSSGSHLDVGMSGIDDYEVDEADDIRNMHVTQHAEQMRQARIAAIVAAAENDTDSDSSPDIEEFHTMDFFAEEELSDVGDDDDEDPTFQPRLISVELVAHTDIDLPNPDGDVDMTGLEDEDNEALEVQEATLAGYPPPPPPPPPAPRQIRDRDNTPSDSDTPEAQPLLSHGILVKANMAIPKTPKNRLIPAKMPKPARYWLEGPSGGYIENPDVPMHEDLTKRLRLDWLILFDQRMWKKVRVDLRDLYISTVVTIPQFKRILGLRFAGLYTTLAQLYLIADREPDYSIISISLQMLTTPSITSELVERGNFLTNELAILYTFLTTRQVGHPHEIFPDATLAFDTGSITNRRMYHFFHDLAHLFSSAYVQERIRLESRYTLQFLDLVKLHQGICPNVRAVGEHVEYETDAWISASIITREINRLCRQFSESFKLSAGDDPSSIYRAIRTTAKEVILNSLGTERKRFVQAEIKEEVRFHDVKDFEFETSAKHSVVKFSVNSQHISFHHALHYTLSWLIEGGKSMSREQLSQLLSFSTQDLLEKPKAMGHRSMPSLEYSPEDHLMAAFDYPLRVCAWLAHQKANMWIRNGLSLRHQQATYRGVQQREVAHHRDIFLLQTAMVVCPPTRVLASMIDRYNLVLWMKGIYESPREPSATAIDDSQTLDVVEDMIHLLIILISDRTSLVTSNEQTHSMTMRRDIAHVLCFKPMAFSEICAKLPDKFAEQEDAQGVLDEMTTFKPPEGLSDVGMFQLKEKFIEDVDPYIAHYNKNQREESEKAYIKWMAKKTGKPEADVMFEAKLRPIESGVFADLSAFTRTGIFGQIIYYSLLYCLKADELVKLTVAATRVEAFLHVVLHLVLIAISEDKTDEDDMSEESLQSFVYIALTTNARSNFVTSAPFSKTIASVLEMLSQKEAFKACHAKIELVLKRMRQKRPRNFDQAFAKLGIPVDRIATASPANNDVQADRERKKAAALARQAKVMAQFQQRQKEFLDKQGDFDWGDEETSDDEMETEDENTSKYWPYPSGICILCQEETGKDASIYGTLALLTQSTILRQTDFSDKDFVREAAGTPSNLDRSAEAIRPFGVAGENRQKVHKVTSKGKEIETERQNLGKGFPSKCIRSGPVSVGCGHVMHFKCFEVYYDASHRRHQHQIARHHPERLNCNEFVCPLCKALGNAFLPVVWSPKEELHPGPLQTKINFADYITTVTSRNGVQRNDAVAVRIDDTKDGVSRLMRSFTDVNHGILAPALERKSAELLMEAWEPKAAPPFTANPRIGGSVTGGGTAALDGSFAEPMKELVTIYRRLRDTMSKNGLPSDHVKPIGLPVTHSAADGDLCASDTLAQALGYSISAVEIQQRGVEGLQGLTFLDTIPHATLTHLRILADTALSYVTIGGIKLAGNNEVAREFCRDYERQHLQLFLYDVYTGTPNIHHRDGKLDWSVEALLSTDIFVFLAKSSLCLAVVSDIDVIHLVQMCYVAELTKVILSLHRFMLSSQWLQLFSERQETGFDSFADFCLHVGRADQHPTGSQEGGRNSLNQPALSTLQGCHSFVKKYATVFLRKSLLLMNVRYGVAFHAQPSSQPDADELDRLSEALRLPSFDDICALASGADESHLEMKELVHGWIKNLDDKAALIQGDAVQVAHPVIFELIGLPKNFDTLMEEVMQRTCHTTGKEISDPTLCLFCGEIFCGQAICCMIDGPVTGNKAGMKIGGAQQHMSKCQKNIGLFLSIRKCCIFYLYHLSGSWMVAPYVDKYGEVDPGLRHSRQLFLNQKRYDALLRTVWLGGGVPSVVSRKLEMDVNNGGWETI